MFEHKAVAGGREREASGSGYAEPSTLGKHTYLFIEGLLPRQPHRVTSGLFTKLNLTEVENTKHVQFTNAKHINMIQKLVPSVLLL